MRYNRTNMMMTVVILSAWCCCAFGLDPSLDISQYAHTAWRVRDGFTTGSISSVAQTPDGYLWVGTEFGLFRFDGVRATPWRPPVDQLPGENIETLLATRDGALWIGTHFGLCRWKDGKLTTYLELQGQHILALYEDGDGTVWAGSVSFPPPGKLCAIGSAAVQCYGDDGAFGIGPIDIYGDHKGNLWVGIEKGMWRWRPGPPQFLNLHADIGGIRTFAQDDGGALLIGSMQEVERFDGRVEAYRLPGFAGRLQTQRMLRDSDGGLWIGTLDRGLLHVHQGKTDSFSKADGLSGDRVNRIMEDREGNIWVATQDGLDRFRSYAIPSLSEKQGLSNAVAWSVLAAKDGSVWIGNNNGLNRWNHGHISQVVSRELTHNDKFGLVPLSLFEDSIGRIWVSTQRDFAYIQDGRVVLGRGYPWGEVRDIVELGPGQLWLAHQQAGLLHFENQNLLERIPWANLGYKDFAPVMTPDPEHKGLWLGFFKGGIAYVANGQVRQSFTAADGLGKGRVNGVRFGPGGSLWIATEGGLSRFKDGKIVTLTSKNGLPCDPVAWSMEDDDRSIWLYTACGLVRIARSEMDNWVADPKTVVKTAVFDIWDGVRGHAVASGYGPRVSKSRDGKIWFTTWDGVSIIDPHHLPVNVLPPPVHIEQVIADGKPYSAWNGIQLPARIHNLAIYYTALSLVAPEKDRFRYKLDGVDPEWREVLNDREVQYSRLGPGVYHFRVKASNNSGLWNEDGASLDFVIPPTWYQTKWFYSLCAAALLAFLWAAYQFRVGRLAYQFNMRLEERVAERMRIARDLHDTLLQSFQGLLPRLQVAVYQLPENAVDARKSLEQAVEIAAEAVTGGRDAVQGLRLSTVEKNDLAQAIRSVGEELASAESNRSRPEFSVIVEGRSRDLHPILRDEVYRIATEGLRNAFQHAAAKKVQVEIRYDDSDFRLRVRDDGKGIHSDVLRGDGLGGHYGLPGMRERAELVGGKLTIWSELGAGTEIELMIPPSRAYRKSPRRFWRFAKRSAGQT